MEMSISEQVKELRKAAKWFEGACFPEGVKLVEEAADTIESLSAKLADMERAAENRGSGWIPCSERLPEEGINIITRDFFEYQVTFESDGVTDIRHYAFGRGHWWNGPEIMDEYVTAWKPIPEAYYEP